MPEVDLHFLYGEYVPRCNHRIDKHFNDYYTLQILSEGIVDLSIGATRLVLRGPHAWSCYPGPRIRFHAHDPEGTWVHRYMAFRGRRVAQWMAQGLYPVPPRSTASLPDLAGRFDQMLALSRRPDPRAALRAAHVLEGMLLDLAEPEPDAAAPDAVVSAARERLESFVNQSSPDYAALAAGLGVSEVTLRRRFRKATGLAPHEYLLQARVAEARKLLAETDLPIKTIADRLGYRDVYFFSRQFRHLTGVPPAVYRRSRLG